MYSCPLHNWSSYYSPCPSCLQEVTSTTDVEPIIINRAVYPCEDCKQLQKQLDYWKALVHEILLQMEWGDKKISLEERIIHLFNSRPEVTIGINYETKSLGVMLNNDQKAQASVATGDDSSTSDGKQKAITNSSTSADPKEIKIFNKY